MDEFGVERKELPPAKTFSELPKLLTLVLYVYGFFHAFLAVLLLFIPSVFIRVVEWGSCYTIGIEINSDKPHFEENNLLPRYTGILFALLAAMAFYISQQKFKYATKLLVFLAIASLAIFFSTFVVLMEHENHNSKQLHLFLNHNQPLPNILAPLDFNNTDPNQTKIDLNQEQQKLFGTTFKQFKDTNFKTGLLVIECCFEVITSIFFIYMSKKLKDELEEYTKIVEGHKAV